MNNAMDPLPSDASKHANNSIPVHINSKAMSSVLDGLPTSSVLPLSRLNPPFAAVEPFYGTSITPVERFCVYTRHASCSFRHVTEQQQRQRSILNIHDGRRNVAN